MLAKKWLTLAILLAFLLSSSGAAPAWAQPSPQGPPQPDKTKQLEAFWLETYPVSIDDTFRTLDQYLLAKASPDECYNGIGNPYIPDPSCPSGGIPKVNEGYVFGLASAGTDLWIGTVANMPCLVLSQVLGLIPPHQTSSWVCEFNLSQFGQGQFPGNPEWQMRLGDWRPPHIYVYNTQTKALVDRTPADPLIHETVGLRAAGTLGDVVLLAGPTLSAWTGIPVPGTAQGMNVFAFHTDGTYLGSANLPQFSDIRKFLVVNGVLYTSVRNNNLPGDGSVLRWRGDAAQPFDFEVVGWLDNEGADLAFHEGRIFVSTWPDLNPQKLLTEPHRTAGLYMSPVLPPGGLDSSYTGSWIKVWSVDDYEADPVTALSYLGGGLASFGGYLYFGSMHFPLLGAVYQITAYNLTEVQDILAAVVGTHRPISIFRGSSFGAPEQKIEVVYGLSHMPVYLPASDTWTVHPNKTGEPTSGPAGFGNFYNTYAWTMDVYQNQLFVGTFDWSYLFPEVLELFLNAYLGIPTPVDLQFPYPGYGADLWRFPSTDFGAVPESVAGVGNYTNYGLRTMLAGDALYLGTANPMNLLTDPADGLPEGGWELIALSGAPGKAPKYKGNLKVPVSLQVTNPCAADGAGEPVQLDGNLHLVYHIFQSKTGKMHMQFHMNGQGIKGTSPVSGNRYVANGVTHFVANSSGLPSQVNFVSNYRLIQTGAESDLHAHFNLHVSISAQGLLQVQVLEGWVDCK